MSAPQVRYAKSGELHIAYQVLGHGDLDLVFVPEWASNIESFWQEPGIDRMLRRLSSFTRLIMFDRRGVGLSDPVPSDRLPALEESMDDVRAVMDAAGSASAALLGVSEGGPIEVMFAASHPERVTALVLANSYARLSQAPDYPVGLPAEVQEPFVAALGRMWGSGDTIEMLAPSRRSDVEYRAWFARTERSCASPGTAVAMFRHMFRTDVRAVLPTLSVPTLVVHAEGNRLLPVGHGRFLAENIPHARYRELSGEDHVLSGPAADEMVDEIQEFLTGTRPGPEADRVLATVLFTDIVESTGRAVALGDRDWRDLLDRHDETIRRQLERFRGRLVKGTGDGALATFDGPARAINCATAIRAALRPLGIEMRAGIHSGEVELRGDDVAGVAVHTAARVSALAEPGEIFVSRTVTDLVAGSGIQFVGRGEHELKGVPGPWAIFEVAA